MLKIVRDTPPAELPEIIKDFKGITEFKFKGDRGVYFLFLNEEIVYIGQSISVYNRIYQHLREGTKEFNRAFYLPVPNHVDLVQVEEHCILTFRPKYNYQTHARSCQPKQTIEDIEYALKQIENPKVDQVYLKEAKPA